MLQCGKQGLGIANETLLSLPFRMSNVEPEEPVSQALVPAGAKAKKIRPAPLAELDELISFCKENRLSDATQGICRVRFKRLLKLPLLTRTTL